MVLVGNRGGLGEFTVLGIEDDGDGLHFVPYVSCYDGEIRSSVSEGTDRVVVSVELRGERSENTCLGGSRVTLDEPLGARLFIDGSTGDSLPTDGFIHAPLDSGNSC